MNEMSTNPLDDLSRDEVLVLWDDAKKALAVAKEQELEMRKYVVARAFPKAQEGTNTLDLGNGYKLKANVKFTYSLNASNEKIKEILAKISLIGNRGFSVAEKLINWVPNFSLTEFRKLEEDAEAGSQEAKAILKECHNMLNIVPAAPTLTITEPKVKK